MRFWIRSLSLTKKPSKTEIRTREQVHSAGGSVAEVRSPFVKEIMMDSCPQRKWKTCRDHHDGEVTGTGGRQWKEVCNQLRTETLTQRLILTINQQGVRDSRAWTCSFHFPSVPLNGFLSRLRHYSTACWITVSDFLLCQFLLFLLQCSLTIRHLHARSLIHKALERPAASQSCLHANGL